jgi:hypothetical protein
MEHLTKELSPSSSCVQIFSSAPCVSNILNVCPSNMVKDQVPHPYKATDKIVHLYGLYFDL